MTSDRDALTTSVLALHAAVDGWAAALTAAADAHPGDPDRAVDDPGLGAAEDAFDTAYDDFQRAATTVLGLDPDADLPPGGPAPAVAPDVVGLQLYATVAGRGARDPLLVLDTAGEAVVEALEAAGYDVPEWGVSVVPVQDLGDDEDDEDEDELDELDLDDDGPRP